MNYLIIQLAAIGNNNDKKERLLIIPQQTGGSNINVTPQAQNFLTISYAEYELQQNNWEAYKQGLITERIASLNA